MPLKPIVFGLLFVTGAATAQDRVGVERDSLDFVDHRLEAFSPRSGPPGTVVTLEATEMPPLAPFRIGVGALRFGFEESGWVLADNDGAFSIDIEIPSWARYDVVHLFIVFDPYFAPVALSDVFHVTNEDGNIRRHGEIIARTNGCPRLIGPDGVPYALLGNLGDFQPGDTVAVVGALAEESVCGAATTIQLVHIESEPTS